MNTTIITGNLTRDIELRYTTTGKAVASFTLAVPDKFNKEKVDFIDCVAWNKLAELCAEYLGKGKKAGVTGRLSNRTYEKQDGTKVKVTEVIADDVEFLSPKGESKPAPKQGTKEDWSDLKSVEIDEF